MILFYSFFGAEGIVQFPMLQIFNLSDFELLEYTSIGQLDFFMKIHYKRVLVNIQTMSTTKKSNFFL